MIRTNSIALPLMRFAGSEWLEKSAGLLMKSIFKIIWFIFTEALLILILSESLKIDFWISFLISVGVTLVIGGTYLGFIYFRSKSGR